MKPRPATTSKHPRAEVSSVGRAAARAEGQRVAAGANGHATVSPAERLQMVAQAAYFRAERRGFAPGGECDDWVQAEREIDELLRSSAA